jgi:glyoxylase-like metal-dependent hydrolase (beta-lactamase superfamily II)
MSNTVAVAVRDSGDVVLVDVGWSAEACRDPKSVGARRLTTGMVVKPGDEIAAQLAKVGIERGRVKTIVATHLHLDHVGGVQDFPNAEVVCGERELEAFRSFPPGLGYRAADLARAGRVRALRLDAGPSYGFPNSADVFGDGEVVLLDARGHTAGNVAVALRTRLSSWVHIGDAAYQSWEYGLSPAGPSLTARITAWKKELVKTYGCIRSCEADPRKPMVVPSHDRDVFDKLPHAPAN